MGRIEFMRIMFLDKKRGNLGWLAAHPLLLDGQPLHTKPVLLLHSRQVGHSGQQLCIRAQLLVLKLRLSNLLSANLQLHLNCRLLGQAGPSVLLRLQARRGRDSII
jgi:hypothetical protein